MKNNLAYKFCMILMLTVFSTGCHTNGESIRIIISYEENILEIDNDKDLERLKNIFQENDSDYFPYTLDIDTAYKIQLIYEDNQVTEYGINLQEGYYERIETRECFKLEDNDIEYLDNLISF